MFKTPLKPARWIGTAVAPLLLLTACATEETAKVSVDRVVGNWEGPNGEKLSFSADRKFAASGLDSKKLAETDCPGDESAGSWGFMVDEDNGSSFRSATAKSGSWIGLGFERQYFGCILELAVVDGGDTLCATNDPDVPCGLDVRFTREK
ncbi:hypothetical protein BM536_038175 [Streptomyces phaeoluteigriseus]|uniref:Lipoprotein n=1 Tax=Streptomyces phaeoluteigriseus TaxID=114686 RepID=A0A1V6MHL8_9ACTN|nr:hypothetical protein [Streptomyces phaeoluteigriseus]OQD51772.1 hypothetical protein BM536_038175 [Streptomyces phaeoluteigriseus]